MYNFLFDKKSFTLLLAGLALAGVLLFSAGLLAGMQWRQETPVTVAAACPPAAPAQPCPEITAPASQPAPAPPPEPAPEPPAEPEPASGAVVASFQPEPEPAPVVAEPELPEHPEMNAFAVQVGAFSRPENSEKVVEDLKSRGYEPYVVELPGRRRVLHTVRIGRYGDWAEARRAAADFQQREGITAIVQPAG